MQYVFRNTTLEGILGLNDIRYSGYDDITIPSDEVDSYVWFYQVPIQANRAELALELHSYFAKLQLVYKQIPQDIPFLIFTLVPLFSFRVEDSDATIETACNEFNKKTIDFSIAHSNVKIIDFSEFTNRYRQSEILDWKYYFISQMQVNPRLAKEFQEWFSQKREAITGQRKKCLVLDLDNTLWGGVLDEDGIQGIQIGGDYPGNAFSLFQKQLLELSKTGVILAICSKNNEHDVLDVLEKNPFLTLRKEHFAAYRINWENKAENLRTLAQELNLGLDSFVFLDDTPSERELIRQMLPEVSVPEFPEKPYLLPVFFKELTQCYFATYSTTREDENRTAQYQANAKRNAAQAQVTSFEDYLKSLDIRTDIREVDSFSLPRVAQMAQKTNQFNLTTKRYSENDLQNLLIRGAHIYTLSVQDKFGDSGMTGGIIITFPVPERAHIDSLFLSCRILGKKIEHPFLQEILKQLKKSGIRTITAEYILTSKNAQVRDFYESAGFILVSESKESKEYRMELKDIKIC
jgi:FkbH-like protein